MYLILTKMYAKVWESGGLAVEHRTTNRHDLGSNPVTLLCQ